MSDYEWAYTAPKNSVDVPEWAIGINEGDTLELYIEPLDEVREYEVVGFSTKDVYEGHPVIEAPHDDAPHEKPEYVETCVIERENIVGERIEYDIDTDHDYVDVEEFADG